MEQIDVKRLEVAIEYINRMAEGNNPLNNQKLQDDNVKKLQYNSITKWLKKTGYLTEEFVQELNKKFTVPTEKGRELGIYTETRTSMQGNTYIASMYNEKAQCYIVNNLEKILDGEIVK